jgi:Ion channel.
MNTLINLVQWFLLPFTGLLGLKLAEMFTRLCAAIRGRQYARELTLAIRKWEDSGFDGTELEELRRKHGWPGYREDWPITKHFLSIPKPLGEFLVSLFRYRWLVPIQVFLVVLSTNRLVLVAGICMLMASVWIGITSLLVDRLVFGYADSYFRKTYANLSADIGNVSASLSQTRQERVQDFFTVFCGIVAFLIVAYAAIYDALDKLAGIDGAFQNVPHNWSRPFHLLYFSIVTVATVGYGDISPRIDSLIARLFTASEIVGGFVLLIVLVTSVSLTFEDD